METSTSSGGSHMADIRTSRSGSVCFEHDYALPTLVFPVSPISFRSGCSGPQMVQNQPVCFSRDPAAPSSSAQTTIGPGGAPSFSSPVVSLPVVFFFSPGQSVGQPSLGDFPQTRSVDTSSWHDLAYWTRFMEAMCLASERNM